MGDVRDLDNLRNLLGEFGQDYVYDYGDEGLAFAAFLRDGTRNRTAGALDELNEVERDHPTEPLLEAALERGGLAVVMDQGETPYRDFVSRLRTWLTESLADPESQRWDLHPRQ